MANAPPRAGERRGDGSVEVDLGQARTGIFLRKGMEGNED